MLRLPAQGSLLVFYVARRETDTEDGEIVATMPSMFTRFRNKLGRHRAAEFSPLAPEEAFTAVGDIHGRYDLLMRLMDRIGAGQGAGRLVFLGDYVDRGEDSAQVLQALFWLQENAPGTVCLRGNHEDMVLSFLEDPLHHGPAWQQHGGRQTLACYGIAPVSPGAPHTDWLAARDSLQGKMGPRLIDWLRNLPAIWQSGNVAVVHAAADPARPIGAQEDQDLIWGHRDFLQVPRRDGTWIIHGHTIVQEVVANQGRIGVDTGAFATGRLSAVAVAEGEFKVLTA